MLVQLQEEQSFHPTLPINTTGHIANNSVHCLQVFLATAY